MKEQQPRGLARRGAGGELGPAAARPLDHPRPGLPCPRARVVARTAVDDDDLADQSVTGFIAAALGQGRQSRVDLGRRVEGWNDHHGVGDSTAPGRRKPQCPRISVVSQFDITPNDCPERPLPSRLCPFHFK
jgi:hypothetical protein